MLSLVRLFSGGGERLQLLFTGTRLHKRSAEGGWTLDGRHSETVMQLAAREIDRTCVSSVKGDSGHKEAKATASLDWASN